MKKIIFFLLLLFPFFVSGKNLDLVSMTPEYGNQNITINNPSNDNDFDITFHENNQNVEYKAIIKNNSQDTVVIDEVLFKDPTSELFEYYFEGIEKDTRIKSGEEKEITILINTTTSPKQTLDNEFNLSFKYSLETDSSNPITGTKGVIIFTSVLAFVAFACVFVIKISPKKIFKISMFILPISFIILANAKGEYELSITGNTSFKIMYNVKVDPNGGIYNGKPEITSVNLSDGEYYEVLEVTREDYNFVKWEINPQGVEIEDGKILVNQNITLKALWDEDYFTLTIDPDGGTYQGLSGIIKNSYVPNTVVELDEAIKTGYNFNHWDDEENNLVANSITMTKDKTITAKYEDKYLNVSIDPNGGLFNGSGEVYTTSVKYNTVIDISNVEKENHTLIGWRKNGKKNIDATSITITEDTNLVARWLSNIQYTVTLDPNGGTYNGSEVVQTFTVYGGSEFLIDDASRGGYLFGHWDLDDGTVVENKAFDVERDITVTAAWDDIICRINSTFYRSIMEAEKAAVNGDTIVLLKDTTEIVTNGKNVTLDLNNHKVTGSITNKPRSNLTIINGTIENTNGIAVINNGILTIGIDDLTPEGKSNIINDNVAIIGTTVGLQQNNKFYFYDGYIEGEVALEGGCDGSPYYRNTFDDTVVHYYPFVSHNNEKDCQHVELEASDKAITKTTVHGEIFYYNLQDNITTSARTGYTIFAVRDFEAAYGITVPAGKEMTFDIQGYDIKVGDNIVNNGSITITDSGTDAGSLSLLGEITNNGTMGIKDLKLSKLNDSNLINNKGTLSLENSTLTGLNGTVLNQMSGAGAVEYKAGTKIISTNGIAISNASANLTLDNVDIEVTNRAINNDNNGTITINGGTIKVTNTADRSITGINNARGTINLNDVTYTVTNTSKNNTTGIGLANRTDTKVVANNITMNVTGIRTTYGVYSTSNNPQFNLKSGTINITSSDAYDSIFIYYGNNRIENGTITVNSERQGFGTSYGVNEILGGTITVQAKKYSQGLYSGTNTVKGGTIIATHVNDPSVLDAYGYGIYGGTNTIIGGTIKGSTYGIRNGNNIIGNAEDAVSITSPVIVGELYGLYSGTNAFYDGILKGKTEANTVGSITTTPAGMAYQTGREGEYETCYLTPSGKYLEVDGVLYNSLSAAYQAVTGDTGTIKAVASITTFSLLPTIEEGKNITLDLNGQTLTYYQKITNKGTLNIIDSSVDKSGSLNNLSTSVNNITNEGTLNITDARVMDAYQVIYNDKKGVVNLTGAYISLANDFRSILGIYNYQGTVNAVNTTITAQNNGNYEVYAFYNNNRADAVIVAENVNINLNGKKNVYVSYSNGNNSKFNLKSGTVNVKCTGNSDAGLAYYGNNIIEGGTVKVESERQSFGIAYGVNEITGGTIDIEAKYYAQGLYSGTNTVTGGTITATNINKTDPSYYGYGISEGTNTILGGTIKGSTHGVRNGNNTIGANDGDISITTPEIIGEKYGIYGGNAEFYDGVLKGKEEAHLGGSITITPDGTAYHNEIIDEYDTCYLIPAGNYLRVGDTEYNSLTLAYQAIEGDSGTIVAIASITTSALQPTIEEGKNITLDLNGQTLTYYQSLVNRGTLNIIDSSASKSGSLNNVSTTVNNITNEGTLNITEARVMDAYRAIYNDKLGVVNITGGIIKIENGSKAITGLYNNKGTFNISDSTIEVINNGSENTYAIQNQGLASNIITIENTDFSVNGKRNVYAIYTTNNNGITNIDGGIINIECLGNSDAGLTYYGTNTISNITANIKSNRQGYGTVYGINEITNSDINVEAKYYAQVLYNGTNTFRSGTLTAKHNDTSNNSYYGYGINDGTNIILGGTIKGSTYGIRYGTNTIGEDDGDISTTSPEIIGEFFGIYGGSNAFYDGILKGKTESYLDESISTIASESVVGFEDITEDGATIHTAYLVPEYIVAKIGDEEYYNLVDAVAAAEEDDTILIVANFIDYDGVVIDAEKTINIDLNGKTIKMRTSITNNGKLHIFNSSDDTATLNCYGTNYTIVNNATGEIELENINISSKNGINNKANGLLNVDGIIANTSNTTIYNSGTMELKDSDITGTEYGIYGYGGVGNITGSKITSGKKTVYTNNNATLTFTNTEINGYLGNNSSTTNLVNLPVSGRLYNNSSGTLNINSITAEYEAYRNDLTLFQNDGTSTVSASTITIKDSKSKNSAALTTVQNYGILNIKDESTIKASIPENCYENSSTVSIIKTSNGNTIIENSNITIDNAATEPKNTVLGVNNENGTTTVKSGNITVNDKLTYGLYVKSGTIVLGVPEEPSSPNYGGEFADVSLTNPHVEAVGTLAGTGVKNVGGHFKFYDGIIIGNTFAKPEVASDIEYLYESVDYTDEDTGYKYCILEWMRKPGG